MNFKYTRLDLADRLVFAVGDIHGCLSNLMQAVDWCRGRASDIGVDPFFVFLGDYVDRGPDSKGVIEYLTRLRQEGDVGLACIKGNHDDMLVKTWKDPEYPRAGNWWEHGGQQTLASYGWNPLLHGFPDSLEDWIPSEHVEFLETMPLVAESANHLFVHAGLRPGIPLENQDPEDLLWIRGDFYRDTFDYGKPVLHGHTPERENPADYGWRIALDAGCFATGRLAVAEIAPGTPVPEFHLFNGTGKEYDPPTFAGP